MSDQVTSVKPDVVFRMNSDDYTYEVHVNGERVGTAATLRQAWLIAGTAFFKAEALRCRKAFLNNEGPS